MGCLANITWERGGDFFLKQNICAITRLLFTFYFFSMND